MPAANDHRRVHARAVLRRCGNVAAVVSRKSAAMGWHWAVVALGNQKKNGGRGFYALQVRLGLEELGPTFVKLGQLLSTRSDLIPPTLQQELSLLRDHAPTIPTEAVLTELKRNSGSASSDVFAKFEEAPVACASVGQVHRATLADGRRVAVKIRRPGIRSQIEADISVLAALARFAGVLPRIRGYDPTGVVDQFSGLLLAETDYTAEAGNIEAVGLAFTNDTSVSIPGVVNDLSAESILVMEWIEGTPLTNAEALEAAGVDRSAMARAIVHAYATMIVRSDRFHADPHPGNFIAMPDGRLGVVDFGEVGTVAPATRTALTGLLIAVVSRDQDALASAVLSIGRARRPLDRTRFSQELTGLLDPIASAELQDLKLGRVLRDLLRVLRSQSLVLPADLAVLIKTVIECEATADELDPTLSLGSFLDELGSVN